MSAEAAAPADAVTVWSLRESQRKPGAADPVVHAVNADTHSSQAWCGARAQFRHHVRPGVWREVTCKRCLAGRDRGRPFARGSR